jgi:RNA polymerase sigma-70 factor (ECF subfamily)
MHALSPPWRCGPLPLLAAAAVVAGARPTQPRAAVPEPFPGEADLVERARTDAAAFGELYQHYAPLIYRFIYNRLRDRATAEDLTSDVFYKALRAIDRYRPPTPFGSWLYRIAANTAIDHLRTRHPASNLDDMGEQADQQPPVVEQVVNRSQAARVWSAIDGLQEAQRTAVSLKLGQDMHTADIAVCMGRSEGAVKLLIHRGLAGIRRQLGAAEGAEEAAG